MFIFQNTSWSGHRRGKPFIATEKKALETAKVGDEVVIYQEVSRFIVTPEMLPSNADALA